MAQFTDLTALTTPTADDILCIVDNPSGIPVSKKITAQNLQATLNLNWLYVATSGTYTSASTFTISGDYTAYLKIGTKIKLNNTSTKYFYVLSSSYSAPNTTVTIVVNTTHVLTNTTVTNIYLSYANPPDFPNWLGYTTILTPDSGTFTSATSSGKFSVHGKTCEVSVGITIATNGTAAGIGVSVPFSSVGASIFCGRENQSTGLLLQGFLNNAASKVVIFNYLGNNINADSTTIYMNGSYAIA